MTLLETPSTTGSADAARADDSIRLEPSGGGEWLVVSDVTTLRGGCALAMIRQEQAGYACYPNALGYGRLGPYPTLEDAFRAAVTRMTATFR
jgi:hypothetical protein